MSAVSRRRRKQPSSQDAGTLNDAYSARSERYRLQSTPTNTYGQRANTAATASASHRTSRAVATMSRQQESGATTTSSRISSLWASSTEQHRVEGNSTNNSASWSNSSWSAAMALTQRIGSSVKRIAADPIVNTVQRIQQWSSHDGDQNGMGDESSTPSDTSSDADATPDFPMRNGRRLSIPASTKRRQLFNEPLRVEPAEGVASAGFVRHCIFLVLCLGAMGITGMVALPKFTLQTRNPLDIDPEQQAKTDDPAINRILVEMQREINDLKQQVRDLDRRQNEQVENANNKFSSQDQHLELLTEAKDELFAVTASHKEYITETDSALQQNSVTIQRLNESLLELSRNSDDHSATIKQLNENLSQFARDWNDTAGSLQGLNGSLSDLGQDIHHTSATIQQLNESLSELSQSSYMVQELNISIADLSHISNNNSIMIQQLNASLSDVTTNSYQNSAIIQLLNESSSDGSCGISPQNASSIEAFSSPENSNMEKASAQDNDLRERPLNDTLIEIIREYYTDSLDMETINSSLSEHEAKIQALNSSINSLNMSAHFDGLSDDTHVSKNCCETVRLELLKEISNLTTARPEHLETDGDWRRGLGANYASYWSGSRVLGTSPPSSQGSSDDHLREDSVQRLVCAAVGCAPTFLLKAKTSQVAEDRQESQSHSISLIWPLSEAPVKPGQYYSLNSTSGTLIIQLAAAVDHIHAITVVSPKASDIIDQAHTNCVLRRFSVDVGTELGEDSWTPLRPNDAFHYEGEDVQTFKREDGSWQFDEPMNLIKLDIIDNHGQPDFTCLYRIQVWA